MTAPPIHSFKTEGIAVSTSSNFGLVGNGRLYILDIFDPETPKESLTLYKTFDTQDGIFDLSWSEFNENHLVTASGDGGISLWDTNLQIDPIAHWIEHKKEVFSVEWDTINKERFCSGSWDGTWNPDIKTSFITIPAHEKCIYQALFSPHDADIVCSISGDRSIKVWDLNVRGPPVINIPDAHDGEILCADYAKYKTQEITTSGTDLSLRTWDLRNTNYPVRINIIEKTHQFAIRRMRYSPHFDNILATASYDMSSKLWDLNNRDPVKIFDCHSEFVLGLDFALFNPKWYATCGWDEMVYLYNLHN